MGSEKVPSPGLHVFFPDTSDAVAVGRPVGQKWGCVCAVPLRKMGPGLRLGPAGWS